LLGRIGSERYVADFSARTKRFSINVQVGIRRSEEFIGIGKFADQIQHGGVPNCAGIAERQTRNRAKMIFELASDRAFNTPVAGIVDARRHFVREQAAIAFKKFDG
jgi:hypothetical protein